MQDNANGRQWKRIGKADSYTVWQNGDVYQVTKGDKPGNEAGYHSLEALLRLKGLQGADMFPDVETIHIVTASEHAEWHAQFNEEPAQGVRLNVTETELSDITAEILERQLEDDPQAGQVDSGIILQTLGDHGLSGAFESLVEPRAEAALQAAAPKAPR